MCSVIDSYSIYVESSESPIKPLQNTLHPPQRGYIDPHCFTTSKPPFIINLSFEEDDDVFI